MTGRKSAASRRNKTERFLCFVSRFWSDADRVKQSEDPSNRRRVTKDGDYRPQEELLLEKVKRKNIIVYLGTGSGKTFIAVMLIKLPHPQGRHPV